MTIDAFLGLLDGVKQRGSRWAARCPAHPDKSPSLSVSLGDKAILIRCFAGCTLEDICSAVNIRPADLFFDAALPQGQRPPRAPRIDRRALAFQFELAALDLRLRADTIIEAGKAVNVASLNDSALDRALGHVAQVHADIERAELFERVADNLRVKEFIEREHEEHRRAS